MHFPGRRRDFLALLLLFLLLLLLLLPVGCFLLLQQNLVLQLLKLGRVPAKEKHGGHQKLKPSTVC